MDMLEYIKEYFQKSSIFYSRHALDEMRSETFGRIFDFEVSESIMNGEIIMSYPEDKPYPSILLYGKTNKGRPLHIVCSCNKEEKTAIVITVYQPDPERWIDYKRRKK
jgi:hypothetical protein